MPDIINNVINDIPSSGHSIYVVELDTFRELQTKFLGGYRVSKNGPSQSYVWDLYALGYRQLDRTSDKVSGLNYYTKRFSSSKFFPLFCSSFTDNAGQNIYEPLPNFSGLTVLNHPVFNRYKYNGSFSFNPLLSTTRQNSQANGEFVIYKASYVPMVPLMVCSSIPTHKSFGPAFLTQFNIGVDGTNSLGDVEISCQFDGGRVIISPDGIKPLKPQDKGNVMFTKTLDPSGNIYKPETLDNFSQQYRTVNLSDCAYYLGLFNGADGFDKFAKAASSIVSDNRNAPPHKIVSMSLSVSQQIDFVFTYPGFSYLDKVEQFYDIAGPRFASLTSRQVTGSLSLFCQTNYNFINTNASSLTMYFGNIFFYTMKNVDWQQPTVTINPGGGYIIKYDFIARLTEETYFAGLGNPRVSEFM
jgi:hypothetical protein